MTAKSIIKNYRETTPAFQTTEILFSKCRVVLPEKFLISKGRLLKTLHRSSSFLFDMLLNFMKVGGWSNIYAVSLRVHFVLTFVTDYKQETWKYIQRFKALFGHTRANQHQND
jgi:hypothetical protein